ncbi:MAG: hypothetical protein K0S04_1220 [Herbinix sp.]|jgi:hypothetical protein|nr:hypothetical protein [Herbinix sp.]
MSCILRFQRFFYIEFCELSYIKERFINNVYINVYIKTCISIKIN